MRTTSSRRRAVAALVAALAVCAAGASASAPGAAPATPRTDPIRTPEPPVSAPDASPARPSNPPDSAPSPSGPPPGSQPPPTAPAPPAPPAPPGDLFARITVVGRGEFTIHFHPAEAPMACANFINLVRRGYYNGQPFNGWTRVVRQATGPVGLASPGYTIRREFSPRLFFEGPGRVGMQRMNEGDAAHPTAFFVTVKEQTRWNLELPVFALVTRGQPVVDSIQKDDVIERIVIEGDPAPLLARFEAQIAMWNRALDAALRAREAAAPTPPPPAPPATPAPPPPSPPRSEPPARE